MANRAAGRGAEDDAESPPAVRRPRQPRSEQATAAEPAQRARPRAKGSKGAVPKTPPTAASEPDPVASTPRPVLRIAALGVVAVLLVAVVATGVLWLRARSSLSDANAVTAAQTGALAAAEQYAVYLTSYDYRHIDADFNRVLDHASASGKFKSQFVKASQDLRTLIIQYKGVSTATVTGAGVSRGAAADRVTVVLFVDQTLTNSNSPTPRVDRNEVQMVVVKVGDNWLIDDVTLPNQAAAAAATPSPAASPGASPAVTPSAGASPASTPAPTPAPTP